tara:strand:- start:109 stop:408 length:300 start_codon:yes stop_codon:yes gene_type:complete
MSKLKELSKIKTRYTNLNEWNDTSFKTLPKRWSKPIDSFRDTNKDGLTELERKEGVVNPVNQKYDFSKPTVITISKDEMKLLHQDGRLEKDGITIIADE